MERDTSRPAAGEEEKGKGQRRALLVLTYVCVYEMKKALRSSHSYTTTRMRSLPESLLPPTTCDSSLSIHPFTH